MRNPARAGPPRALLAGLQPSLPRGHDRLQPSTGTRANPRLRLRRSNRIRAKASAPPSSPGHPPDPPARGGNASTPRRYRHRPADHAEPRSSSKNARAPQNPTADRDRPNVAPQAPTHRRAPPPTPARQRSSSGTAGPREGPPHGPYRRLLRIALVAGTRTTTAPQRPYSCPANGPPCTARPNRTQAANRC